MRKFDINIDNIKFAIDKINEMCKISNRWPRKQQKIEVKFNKMNKSQKVVVIV